MNTSWCSEIYTSIDDHSSWKTSIFFPTSLFSIYNLTGISPDVLADDESNNVESYKNIETEADNEMEVARTTEMDTEVDVDNNSNIDQPINDSYDPTVSLAEADPSTHSSSSNLTNQNDTNFLKPNEKPDIDILLFLNPACECVRSAP